jgi:hypothetical protein
MADEHEVARALVEKAIIAQGGEAALRKYPASLSKYKGIFHGVAGSGGYTRVFRAFVEE